MPLDAKIEDIEIFSSNPDRECANSGHKKAQIYLLDAKTQRATFYCEKCNGYFTRNLNDKS